MTLKVTLSSEPYRLSWILFQRVKKIHTLVFSKSGLRFWLFKVLAGS